MSEVSSYTSVQTVNVFTGPEAMSIVCEKNWKAGSIAASKSSRCYLLIFIYKLHPVIIKSTKNSDSGLRMNSIQPFI